MCSCVDCGTDLTSGASIISPLFRFWPPPLFTGQTFRFQEHDELLWVFEWYHI